MPCFRVKKTYECGKDGVDYAPWTPGQEVYLTAELAAWVQLDEPGVLTAIPSIPPEQRARRQANLPPNRAYRPPTGRYGDR
jgi:hypothetical protein